MATNLESDFPSSPRNHESDAEDQEDPIDDDNEPDEPIDEQPEEEDIKPAINNNVADILKRLQSSGALIKVPKQEYRCNTCDEDFLNWEELENHLIQHVSLPSLVLDKLPSDEEDNVPSGDDNWSDEEEEAPSPPKPSSQKTPKKIDISQILNKTGLSIKKPGDGKETSNANATLNKLSGLGFTIKKNSTPIKNEKPDQDQQSNKDVMQKLGQLGGIKLKLKSDGNKANTFKVVNGLKDFKASDDEDEKDGETDDEQNKSADHEDSDDEHNAHNSSKNSESDESDKMPIVNKKNIKIKTIPEKTVIPKVEKEKTPIKTPVKTQVKPPVKAPASHSALKQVLTSAPSPRPTIKQTPKRGSIPSTVPTEEKPSVNKQQNSTQGSEISTTSIPERRESRDTTTENVVIKKEVDTGTESPSANVPLFSGQIKSERTTPPLSDLASTPAIATIKTEPDSTPNNSQPLFVSQSPSISTSASIAVTTTSTTSTTTPLLPITKTEDTGMTVIEINGDSNDEDDDCCVVSATPAPDIKPVIPKTESQLPPFTLPNSYSSTQSSSYSSAQPSYSSASLLSSRMPSTPSTEKQHSFNWNAPDSKPAIDILEKSTDDMLFERLLSSDKKESLTSISDASEYVSLDSLGPQHSCEVCNTRFTNILHLEEHKRVSGHSMSLVAPSSNLLPYNPSSNILSSLLPVKQLAEQVGKLSAIGNTGSGFTHQQNVMINIQAYPGASGVMVPPYNNYSGQNMHSGYQQTTTDNMYNSGLSGMSATMPGQYPGQSYIGGQSGYSQYQQPMSKPAYPGTMPHNSYETVSTSSPYSAASPLQSMQQAVYGQSPAGLMNPQQMGSMGAPVSSAHLYAPAASPSGTMKPPTSSTSGIKIQNVQTFAPGQLISASGAQVQPGPQMNTPSPIRMASGANVTGPRPRMPSVRGGRPSIRPGIQVQGQVRGAKAGGPRMPLKRPAGAMAGPGQKRRPDMLLPGKHDNEDCQVMAMQKQRDGLPMIQSVQGAKDKLNLSQISITKKTVNKEANAMANVLASRGISIKQKQKSRSPSPERPIPHIPNLGAGVSIKHTSKSSNFSIPEAKVGGGMVSCKICRKMFMNHNSLSVHMAAAHPQSKLPVFKCDECPASYPKSLQLQHHKRVFHNVTGPNRELGLPVVDLSQEDNLKRLSSLGIYSFIPLANREQASGSFGIPVISVHNMQNGITNSLKALGADGLLSLGPLKPLPNT